MGCFARDATYPPPKQQHHHDHDDDGAVIGLSIGLPVGDLVVVVVVVGG